MRLRPSKERPSGRSKADQRHEGAMSALPPKADIKRHDWHVRFVPEAAVSRCSNTHAEFLTLPPARREAIAEQQRRGCSACEPATIFLYATAIWRDRLSGDGLAATCCNRHPRRGLALQHRRRFFSHH